MIHAYSDASYDGHCAHLGVLIAGQPHYACTPATDNNEAELLAAQLAVQRTPDRQILRLHTDAQYVAFALRQQGAARHHPIAQAILHDARARGVHLHITLIRSARNPAHHVARQVIDQRRPLPLRWRGHELRGPGLRVPATTPTLALLRALIDVSHALPPGTHATLRVTPCLSAHYWMHPGEAPPHLQPHLHAAHAALHHKGTRLTLKGKPS